MNHYHVGIVVTDIEAASARLSEMLGVTWGPVMAARRRRLPGRVGQRRHLAHDDAVLDRGSLPGAHS